MSTPAGDFNYKDAHHSRIRIAPAPSNSTTDCFDSFWCLLNCKECLNIHQVKSKVLHSLRKISKKSESKRDGTMTDGFKKKYSLWLSESMIPSFESSHILRDGDTVHLLISHIPYDKDIDISHGEVDSSSMFESKSPDKVETKQSLKRQYPSSSQESADVIEIKTQSGSKKQRKSKTSTINPSDSSSSRLVNEQSPVDMGDEEHDHETGKDLKHKKKSKQNGIGDNSGITESQVSLYTPEIQELLQSKMAEFENKGPQIDVNGKGEDIKDNDNEFKKTNGGNLGIEKPTKRKRSRRKKNKSQKSDETSIEKLKPPPNYSLNLPTENSRVVFEESDEDTTEVSQNVTKLSSLQESVDNQNVVPPSLNGKETSIAHSTNQKFPPQSLGSHSQFSRCIVPNYPNKESSKQVGNSIDPNVKFSELINRTHRRRHQLSGSGTQSVSTAIEGKASKLSQMDASDQQNVHIADRLEALSEESSYSTSTTRKDRLELSKDRASKPRITFASSQLKAEVNSDTTKVTSSQDNCNVNLYSKIYTNEDIEKALILTGKPGDGDIIAFKMMELGEDYTPRLSDFKIGKVLSCDSLSDTVVVELQDAQKKRTGRFELDYGDEEEVTEDSRISTSFGMLQEVRLVCQ